MAEAVTFPADARAMIMVRGRVVNDGKARADQALAIMKGRFGNANSQARGTGFAGGRRCPDRQKQAMIKRQYLQRLTANTSSITPHDADGSSKMALDRDRAAVRFAEA